MATINNQATLTFSSGGSTVEVASNKASVTLQGPLTISKRSLETSYQLDNTIVYTVEVKNTSTASLQNVTVKDDLGTYNITATAKVTPLTYVGPAQRFENGTHVGAVTATVDSTKTFVTFSIGTVAAGSTEIILYKVKTNNYAKGATGSTIISTASVTADGVSTPVTFPYTLTDDNYADVVIEKSMTPDPIVDGGVLSYVFVLKNYGNAIASDVVLKDTLSPIPAVQHTYVDGTQRDEHDFSTTTGEYLFPGLTSTYDFAVPAATITQDATTGVVSIVPGTHIVRVDGII